MPIFEKTEYWGLKDPLEVRVQHGTCIYMGDTFSSHFEPKKFNRVGRRGQKQPKWGIFGGTKIPPFWLFLAPPAHPVEFFWFKMAGKGVPHSFSCDDFFEFLNICNPLSTSYFVDISFHMYLLALGPNRHVVLQGGWNFISFPNFFTSVLGCFCM